MFPQLERDIDLSKYAQSLRSALLRRNYPSDSRIRQNLPTLPLYDTRRSERLILFLETLNRYLSNGTGGHTVLDGEATVEHLMPQTISAHAEWKQMIGDNWEEVHRDQLHTLGNLTLVTQEWNSSLSNSAFRLKKQKLAGHALLLNARYFSQNIENWNQHAIKTRAEWLTNLALEVWSAFGEPPASQNVTGHKPLSLTVLGEVIETKSWRDVAIAMAEKVILLAGKEFDSIVAGLPAYFTRFERNRTRQLSNGWWFYYSLSSSSVLQLCDRLAAAVSLSSDDWEITLETE